MLDLYGYGPLIKAISFAFLCYSVVFTNSKVPIMFFVLYTELELYEKKKINNYSVE